MFRNSMFRNPFWILFISLIILGVLGYQTYTLMKVWQYGRLNKESPVQYVEWAILPVSDDSFIPLAHYSFRLDGKDYKGETLWQESYLNQWAAQEAIARMEKRPPSVWFNSSSPEISSLQKYFPLKESLYSILLLILGVYFLILGYRVNQRFF